MILNYHPSHPGRTEWHNRNFIGYWQSQREPDLPAPQDFVDESWDAFKAERERHAKAIAPFQKSK